MKAHVLLTCYNGPGARLPLKYLFLSSTDLLLYFGNATKKKNSEIQEFIFRLSRVPALNYAQFMGLLINVLLCM